MRKPIVLALAILTLCQGSPLAQTSASADVPRMAHGQPIHDALSRAVSRLARTAQPVPQPPQSPKKRNWFARHPVLTGTIAGAGVGLAFAAAEGCDSSDYSCGGIVGFFVGVGAALGAAGGLVAAAFLR